MQNSYRDPAVHQQNGLLDLTHVYRNCVFRSDARLDSHAQVAGEFSDHNLHWKRGPVETALFKASANRLKLFVLRYGAEVEVTPRPFDDFALVHLSLQGGAEIISDGTRVAVPQGRSALIAPRKSLHMWWQQGSEQLILKVPHSLMREQGMPESASPVLPPIQMMNDALVPQWRLLMQSLLSAISIQEASPGHAAWVDHFERNIGLFLLSSHTFGAVAPSTPQPDAHMQAQALGAGLPEGGAARRLDALDEYMQRRLCAPVALVDLAAAAGVSVRTLNMLCHRHRGASPMDLLRNMRLDAARDQLLSSAGANVTDTALQYGFGHLGRFSAYYRERFGELPSETSRRG